MKKVRISSPEFPTQYNLTPSLRFSAGRCNRWLKDTRCIRRQSAVIAGKNRATKSANNVKLSAFVQNYTDFLCLLAIGIPSHVCRISGICHSGNFVLCNLLTMPDHIQPSRNPCTDKLKNYRHSQIFFFPCMRPFDFSPYDVSPSITVGRPTLRPCGSCVTPHCHGSLRSLEHGRSTL